MGIGELNNRREEIESLVERVKEGDQNAFSALYDIFIDHIYKYVYYRVKSSDVDDLVVMVFLKIWENIHKYKAKKNLFASWIFRIAHNLVVDYYRTSKDRDFDELSIDVPSLNREHNPIKNIEKGFDQTLIKRALHKLKRNYQDIITYKFINEFTNSEIAQILRKSEGSLRILQYRALKALKRELEEMGISDI